MIGPGDSYEGYEVKTTSSDRVASFPGYPVIGLGVVLILFGLLSIALGVGSICTWSSGYYIAYGIWCGFMFCLSGIVCILAGYKKSICLIVATCALSVLTICLGATQMSLGMVAADNDQYSKRQNYQVYVLPEGYLRYDIYYERNNPYKYICSGPNKPFAWSTSFAPIDILLLIAGFICMITSLIISFLTCFWSCNGIRSIVPTDNYSAAPAYQDDYMSDARMSPVLYKN